MAFSVQKDRQGPDWPLGNIAVVTPGTPVGIMSLVDPASVNDPSAATSATSDEYTVRCQQIFVQGFKAGSHGLVPNTGNIYLVRKPTAAGTGGRDDLGCIVLVVPSGQSFFYSSASQNRNVFSPYRYSIDADNAGDSAQVTLIIQ